MSSKLPYLIQKFVFSQKVNRFGIRKLFNINLINMKKIYTLGLIGMSTLVFAQAPKLPSSVTDFATPATKIFDRTTPSPVQINPDNRTFPNEYFGKSARSIKIGTTQNDQQTNATIYRHIHAFDSNRISVTWTTSTDQSPYVQRGSGYNHFNGSTWGPISAVRVEPNRAGFPSYSYNPTTNEEIIISHRVIAQGLPNAGAAGGLYFNRKTGLGSGTWNTNLILDTIISYPGVLWNRNAVSGDYLHVIASYTDSSQQQPTRVKINGIRSPTVYSRYKFSSDTWEVKNIFLPNYDSTRSYNGRADSYAIDAVGDNVAILMGGLTDDVTLWTSNDNGTTWNTTIVDSFPVGAYNYKTLLDTSYTNDGTVSVILDNNGKAHCFYGLGRVLDTDTTDESISFFPGQTNMIYWNETMSLDSVRSIAGFIDEDNDPNTGLGASWNAAGNRYGNHSIVTMPHAASTANGHIYLIYSSLADNDISDGKNYRDIYIIRSTDGGETWTSPTNLTKWLGFNVEQIFGSINRVVTDKIHISFMQKNSIGRYDATNNPTALGPYDIYHMVIDTAGLFGSGPVLALNELKSQDLFEVEQNFPNPFEMTTSVNVNFNRSSDVSVKITDLMGRVIGTSKFNNVPAGKSTLDLQIGNVPAGVYFYTIEADGLKVTRKMLAK